VYRPTVRYDDLYKEYVDNVFSSTHLSRNQIIRAALFIAGHTEQFSKIIEPYLKRGMSLPAPLWSKDNDDLWYEQQVNVPDKVPEAENFTHNEPIKYEQRRIEERPIASPKVFSPGGGISIKFGSGNR
jgi:hypothetical protein